MKAAHRAILEQALQSESPSLRRARPRPPLGGVNLIVVDAAVAVKWVVAEEHSEAASALQQGPTLHAPAHWMAESINALWAKTVRGDLSAADASSRAAALAQAPVRAAALAGLSEAALASSLALRVAVCDSLCIVLAQRLNAIFVTSDLALGRKAAASSLPSGLVHFVGAGRVK